MAQKSDELQRIEENGQKIRDLINEMESDADDLDTKLSEAEEKISDLEEKVETLEGQADADAKTIEELSREIQRLEDRS